MSLQIANQITDDFMQALGATKARIEVAIKEAVRNKDAALVQALLERKIQIAQAESGFFSHSYHLNTIRAWKPKRKRA